MSRLSVEIRQARPEDLPAIVALIADDDVARSTHGVSAEVLPAHREALATICDDPHQLFMVAVTEALILGCFQLSFVPGLSRSGAWRGQIETVRVASDARGQKLGEAMMDWAIAESRRRGCALVQLTTDKTRGNAHRFYERLGFIASHEGMKLDLRKGF